MTTDDLRDLVKLGGPVSKAEARRLSLRATRDIPDADRAHELHRLLVDALEEMVNAYNLGEALGHDLLADGMLAERALDILDRIDVATKS